MDDKVSVDIGDKVRNMYTGEIFIVEHLFTMRKVSGGKYTSNKKWSQLQLLNALDWEVIEHDNVEVMRNHSPTE